MEDTAHVGLLPKHQGLLWASVYDGHGGRQAADFCKKNSHLNFAKHLPTTCTTETKGSATSGSQSVLHTVGVKAFEQAFEQVQFLHAAHAHLVCRPSVRRQSVSRRC